MIIVKVPGINGLGKTAGARDAGGEILKGVGGNYRHEEIHVDNSNLEEQEALIKKNAVKLFGEEDRVIFLGGDHSISYGTVGAFVEEYGSDARVVVFDAHADCMPPMKEPTHEEWLRAVLERTKIVGEPLLLVGLNKVEDEEMRFLKEKGVKIYSGDVEEIREFVSGKKVYVSFDIDVFEGAKATGYPEGKMKESDVMELLDVILSGGNLVGCDIVEVNLEKEGLDETLRLARKVLGKFIGK